MSKLILSILTSLDMMTARPDGDLNWFFTDDDFEVETLALLRSVDAMLLGRVTYEMFAEYWPKAGTPQTLEAPGGFTSHEREVAFAEAMNSTPKIVHSRTLERAEWGPATIVRDVIPAEVEQLKREAKRDLVLFAGARLASAFIELDLFDEYRLMIHPIILGKGQPLFRDLTQERKLRLTREKRFASGVVLAQYERDRDR